MFNTISKALIIAWCSISLASANGALQQIYTQSSPGCETNASKQSYIFIAFSCHVCRQLHPNFSNWQRTLPKPYSAEYVPVVASQEHIYPAIGFYAAKRIATSDQMERFSELLFQSQLHSLNINAVGTALVSIAQQSGLDVRQFAEGTQSDDVIKSVERARQLTNRFAIDRTPTTVINECMVTTPDNAHGENATYFQLLNGLVSRYLQK